jgi:hypothetical protein
MKDLTLGIDQSPISTKVSMGHQDGDVQREG